MNPLARWLINKLAKCENVNRASQLEDALSSFGYWCLTRPKNYRWNQIPETSIVQECTLVMEFATSLMDCEDYMMGVFSDNTDL